ncbi:MAG TPA: hypothetical protein VLK84_13220 [Longimicrobium sp.]|nr:hypothetical protein [Longimicrobium sp.]
MRWMDRLSGWLGWRRTDGSEGSRDADELSEATDLAVDYDEPLSVQCECCGAPETRLTRFVKRDGGAYAVYLVRYTKTHELRQAYGIVSLGTWWEDGVPPDRVAFALRVTGSADEYQLEVIDANQLAWQESEILGQKLNRDEALAHPWISDVYHLFDHMAVYDAPLHAFLNGS